MTHDLLRNVIQDLDAIVQKIVVCDLQENTFYALIYLAVNGDDGGDRCAAERRDRAGAADRARRSSSRTPSSIRRRPWTSASEKADADRLQQWLESLDPDDLGKYKM